MKDVVALGELLIDFTCIRTDAQGYPTMEAHPGGAPANFLAALSRFGASTALLGKVGTDAFGQMLIGTLEQAGICAEGICRDSRYFTTLAFVTLDSTGNRTFSFARKPGADTQLSFGELDLRLIEEARVFHFGSLSLTQEPSRSATKQAVAYAKSKGKLITYDPNLRKPLWPDMEEAREQILWGLSQADVVKISDEEVEFLFGLEPEQGASHILDRYGCALVFVTCGARGCHYATRNIRGNVPGLSQVRAVDTTGAGDIFGGSAIWKLLQTGRQPEALSQEELQEITAFAVASSGLSVEKAGGISSVPDLEQILARMRQMSR